MKNQPQQPHLSNSVVMVKPLDFGYNPQTALDNEFQHSPGLDENRAITQKALAEFEASVTCLKNQGVEVLTLDKAHTSECLPDAIFPNNWFSTRNNGSLIIYPMKTKNRQAEVQEEELLALLKAASYDIAEIIDLRKVFLPEEVLEGTGSLVFHHPTNRLFATISDRCQEKALKTYSRKFDYQLVKFNSSSSNGHSIYHTNVLMSCGKDFAVIAAQVISSQDKTSVLNSLYDSVSDLLIITEQQMSQHLCANILQLEDNQGQPVIALSESAYQGYTPAQRRLLERHGNLAVCPIPTIERIGGGSIRCMLAENFLKKC